MTQRTNADYAYPPAAIPVARVAGLGALATQDTVAVADLDRSALDERDAEATDLVIVYRDGAPILVSLESILNLA